MATVTLPDLGEGIKTAVVSCWYVKPGDKVGQDDDVVELATDKATFNVSAGSAGIIKKILVKEGEEVNIGESLAVIE